MHKFIINLIACQHYFIFVIMKSLIRNKTSHITLLIIIFIASYTIFKIGYWKGDNKVITWDVSNYYSYLPATFLFEDPLLNFTKENPEAYYDKFVPLTMNNGNKIIKMSMGLSMLYSPFFLIAHLYAKDSPYPDDGYSEPYRLMLILSSLFFFIIGLYFLLKILSLYFNPVIVSLSLIAVGLGTNLYYYVVIRSAMSHSYNFALITVFIWLTLKWYERKKYSVIIPLGVIAGLISLIRPTNIIIILFFFLWKIQTYKDLKHRMLELIKDWKYLLIFSAFAFIIWLPQLIYWKAASGHWLYYSYLGERFFFSNPQIIKGMFSYRNGWLLYTPMMIFSITGFVFLSKKLPDFFIAAGLITILFIYIILSWWCWWYVGFGNRAFIDLYGLLAIPLAVFIEFMTRQKMFIKNSFIVVFCFLLILNLFQTWQYYKGYIQFDSMTKKAYWVLFANTDPKDKFWQYLSKPDYDKALKGIYEDLEK